MSGNYFWATTLSFVLFTCCNIVSLFGVTEFKVSRSESLYGKGVHAFFDKDYEGAICLLTQAEQLGSEDPRPYYFLALSHFRLKQNDKADNYFKKAARFEWEGQSARDYDVSGALRRIQGNERLHVERYRHQAKLDWQHAEKRKRDILYANEKNNEKRILTEMAKHPVVAAPFGAQSIDPLGTGKKIEVQILEDSSSKPKKELLPAEETTPSNSSDDTKSDDTKSDDTKSDDTESDDTKSDDTKSDDTESDDTKSDDTKSDTNNMTTSDHSDNNSKEDENKKEDEESEDDPFK